MNDILVQRRRERDELIAAARRYVDDLAGRVSVVAASVAGSVARGDFNLWSDIDVVVVAENLPAQTPDRMTVLMEEVFPRVQPVGYTIDEFRTALQKRNPLVCEAVEKGVLLVGDMKTLSQPATRQPDS